MSQDHQVSGFVAQIAEEQKRDAERRAGMKAVAQKCEALTEAELPPLPYVNIIGSNTYGHYRNAMRTSFEEFVDRFRLTSSSHILDIGCGCGRLAMPFSMYLEDGAYYGIDVWEDGIKWCQDHISTKNSNMEFFHIDAKNNYYFEDFNPEIQNDFKLGMIPDQSLDFAFAISVFTHLSQNDSLAYLKEVARTLKQGGAAYLTAFIIDDFFFDYRARTKRHGAVKEFSEGCYHAYHGQDFFAGFTRRLWNQMCEEAGLRIIASELGSWAEKPSARVYQDTFVVMRQKQ